MKVAVFTLCRERLEYSKVCLESLREKAGIAYDHYIVDQGSEDRTVQWLLANAGMFKSVILNERNRGIGVGSNQALEAIFGADARPDLCIKYDNDCLTVTPGILARLAEIYTELEKHRLGMGPVWALSPRVEGLVHQPIRHQRTWIPTPKPALVGITGMIGGIFLAAPARAWAVYRFPEVGLPKARGYDSDFCAWLRKNGGQTGYVEELAVEHIETTDGQARRYPEYFRRKKTEEAEIA